jgi:DNA-directed RNA polymerase subunit RPC12/RpoP
MYYVVFNNVIADIMLVFHVVCVYPYYMEIAMFNRDTKWFPCPVCLQPLDVRTSKRNKPYVICSPCGVQMFIRERAGIEAFASLVEQGLKADVLTRIGQLEQRYKLKCPECGKLFWASPELLGTNWFNTKASGYRCPEKNCRGVVPIAERSDTRTDGSPTGETSSRSKGR